MKYRITLAYDGAEYFGWQTQVGQPTIQSVLNGALERLEGAGDVPSARIPTLTGRGHPSQIAPSRQGGDSGV